MKRMMILLLTCIITFTGVFVIGGDISLAALAASNDHEVPKVKNMSIEVLIDARRVAFPDERPQINNGTTFVPLRFVSDKLGGALELKGKDITIVKGDRTVKLTIGAKTATVNGETVTLDKASFAKNGRTLVPLRFVSEALGENVKWDAPNQYIWIGSTEVPTLEEISTPIPIKPYLHLYEKGESLINYGAVSLDQVRLVNLNDFPIKFEKQIIYRMDYAAMNNGLEYLRSVTDSKALIGHGIYLLQKGEPAKFRAEISYLRERVTDFSDYRVKYHKVAVPTDEDQLGIKDYNKIRLKDIQYVGLSVDADTAVLIKNDFTE
ncbi:stalk domain-containing protein [Paenibacillus senegalimassiliensis]|uniref:stalk domain-containing protein n=1 Tax=Paenibacillus senegalimassiliensis TaxID=1737426 RepID=UPI00073F1745|nr:stalk domain-containing protein [Paenibacillus senegalimassiliensis]